MLLGIKFKANPTNYQKQVLSSWMGAAKFVWNAKCDEDKYLRCFARKYLSIGTWPKPDQKYSQYKNEILSPFLSKVPSQILRNSSASWFDAYKQFFKQKDRGRPKRKLKGKGMSILLTRELFEFKKTAFGLKLFVGTLRNNIGFLDVKWHSKQWLQYGLPNSIRIKKLPSGMYTVSFCYQDRNVSIDEKDDRKNWFNHIKANYSREDLEKYSLGIDRGVNVPVATNRERICFKKKALINLKKYEKRIKKNQQKLSKQKKGSKRFFKRKLIIAKNYNKRSNIRENECHHISKKLVDSNKKIFILENLLIKNQTKSAKGDLKKPGKRVKAKSGLNREILNISWYRIENQLIYKSRRKNKVVFKINPAYTSQECANCGHTHSDNRSGINFKCMLCGNNDHSDTNASKVIKKRAVNLFLHSGTELSDKGVLSLPKDIGHGAKVRPLKRNSKQAQAKNSPMVEKRCQKRKEVSFCN